MTRKLQHILIISLVLIVMAFAGCVSDPTPTTSSSGGTQPSATPTPDQPATASTNSSTSGATPPESATGGAATGGDNGQAKGRLAGTYTLAEVEHDGTVDMISSDNATEIRFRPDVQSPLSTGTFNRTSRMNKKVDHIDTGQYLIEPPDKFSLNILTSKRQMVNPPVRKDYKYALSPDGDELRLTAPDGKMALFRRTKPLPEK